MTHSLWSRERAADHLLVTEFGAIRAFIGSEWPDLTLVSVIYQLIFRHLYYKGKRSKTTQEKMRSCIGKMENGTGKTRWTMETF